MSEKPSIKQLGRITRKAVSVASEDLISTGYLEADRPLPLLVQPSIKDVSLVAWAAQNREFIETELGRHGGILFRNFRLRGVQEFEGFIGALAAELLKYTYASTPRSHVSGNIYTSTEYPADQPIPLHNEMSYARQWPLKIWFYCVKAAEQGGATPIADSARVFERISPAIRERFMKKEVMYMRNYGAGIDLPWQQVFGTTSRAEVEDYCRRTGMEFEWLGGGSQLRTRQRCQAVATHPVTGRPVWFNQAHLFHISSLRPAARAAMLDEFKEEDLPRHAFYGDGSPIEEAALDEIREAYRREAVAFAWQEQDVLMLDNMAVAHGREPYDGPRSVVVGMAEPFSARPAQKH